MYEKDKQRKINIFKRLDKHVEIEIILEEK